MYKVGSLPSLSGLFLCISNNINITSCFIMTPIQEELARQNNKIRHLPKIVFCMKCTFYALRAWKLSFTSFSISK